MKAKTIVITIIVVVLVIFSFWKNTTAPTKMFENGVDSFSKKENSEAEIVTNYIKQNIKTIATNKPVMGGQWYVVSVVLDPKTNSGSVVYEDGHIQSSANFKYSNNGSNVEIADFSVE